MFLKIGSKDIYGLARWLHQSLMDALRKRKRVFFASAQVRQEEVVRWLQVCTMLNLQAILVVAGSAGPGNALNEWLI